MRNERESFAGMAAFVAVVESASFSAAADKLRLTPSGVSKLVSRLEDRLGARLLQRTTRRMQLTQAGAAYFERARRLLEEFEALSRETASQDDTPRGTLRVTAPTVLGHVRVLPVLLSFQRAFPEVKAELALTDRAVDLVEEGVDVAVRMTATPPLSFIARKLDDDVRVLCATPGYLKRRGCPRHPRELADHDGIGFVTGSAVSPWRLRAAAGSEEIESARVKGRLQVNNTLSVREAALTGLGIADLPRYLVEDDLLAGRLLAVLPEFGLIERSIYAVYGPGPFVPARVREFVKYLVAGFAKGKAPRPARAVRQR